jgi:hypothetical protein
MSTVYNQYWTIMKPPQYRLDLVGRGGRGHCFSSSTVSEAYPCWVRGTSIAWPTDELYVSYCMRFPHFVLTEPVNENIKIFYPTGTAPRAMSTMPSPGRT